MKTKRTIKLSKALKLFLTKEELLDKAIGYCRRLSPMVPFTYHYLESMFPFGRTQEGSKYWKAFADKHIP